MPDSPAASPSLTSKLAKGFNILKNLSPKLDRKNENPPSHIKEPTPKNSPKMAVKNQEATPKSSPKLLSRIFGGGSSPKPVPKIEVTASAATSNGHTDTEKKDDVKVGEINWQIPFLSRANKPPTYQAPNFEID